VGGIRSEGSSDRSRGREPGSYPRCAPLLRPVHAPPARSGPRRTSLARFVRAAASAPTALGRNPPEPRV